MPYQFVHHSLLVIEDIPFIICPFLQCIAVRQPTIASAYEYRNIVPLHVPEWPMAILVKQNISYIFY
jgi:hypothetical protein